MGALRESPYNFSTGLPHKTCGGPVACAPISKVFVCHSSGQHIFYIILYGTVNFLKRWLHNRILEFRIPLSIFVICNGILRQSVEPLLIFRGNKDARKAVSVGIIVPADSLGNTLHIQD